MYDRAEFIRCYAIIDAACRVGIGINIHLVEQMLESGEALLYTGNRSAIIVELLDLPEGRVWSFAAAAGDMDELIAMKDNIEVEARSQGVHKYMLIGRPGWKKALPDYHIQSVILTKGFQ